MSSAPATIATIVIPVWNLWETTRDCLISLRRNTPAELFQVRVADNGSTDETAAGLEPMGTALFPGRFGLTRFPENRGFAVACNAGGRAADTPYVLFLNNDTLVQPGWLEPLLEALAASDRLAGVGPLLLYPEGRQVQHCGVALSPLGTFVHIYRNFPAAHQAVLRPREVQALTAAALLLRREDFLACNGFYEGYRNGFEDLDLCARLAEGGKAFRCVPESRVWHLESRTPGRNDADIENSGLLRSRVFSRFKPDMQRLAGEDSMFVRLTDALEPVLSVSDAQSERLELAVGSPPNPARCRELLEAHPAWQRGYALLAEALADRDPAEALAALRTEAEFFPGLALMHRLLAQAEKTDAPAVRLFARRQAAFYAALDERPEALLRQARHKLEWANANGFADAAGLLENWLRARGALS